MLPGINGLGRLVRPDRTGSATVSNIKRRALTTALALAAIVGLAGDAAAVTIGPHEATFVAVRYDYPTVGKSTWYYTIRSNAAANAISHVVFRFGACANSSIVAGGGTWGPTQDNLSSRAT